MKTITRQNMRLHRFLMVLIAAICGNLTVVGQETGEQFSIATLNVDGLPQKILVFKLNVDGPGDAGTARIGKYLMKKGYDLVMMQEDFNYHHVLTVFLEDDYKFDTWSGDLGFLDGHKADFLHLQNHRFECDGLMACWKNDLSVTPSARTAWTQNFGKFSHANDEMVTKGFRRYDVTLRNGERIIVYNLHMDASLDEDEAEANDAKDKAARMAQWAQLKEDIMQNLDSRPIIISGDANSLYGRDDVKKEFIDAINESGKGTVADVWVELQQEGNYPTKNDNGETSEQPASGETLDKILYINPTLGTKIQPVAFTVDRDGYQYDGKALGDHWPVAATFQVTTRTTDIENLTATPSEKSEGSKYTLSGVKVRQMSKGIYIERNGEKAEKHIIK